MMVASSSLANLEHRYRNSDSDMAYHIHQISDGQTFEQHSDFNTQTGSFNTLNDPAFRLPLTTAYKDSVNLPERRSDGNSSGSSPIHYPPPAKRLASGSPTSQDEQLPDEVLETLGIEHDKSENSRFASVSMDHEDSTFDINASNIHCYNHPSILDKKFDPGLEFQNSSNKNIYAPTSSVMKTPVEDVNENTVTTSPSATNVRHLSQSSSHSSSSTASKSTTPSRTKSQQTSSNMQQVPNFFFDDDDDDSWKICAVCSDKATGYHFNALTCEGCKGFFRRSMKNSKTFTCPYTGNCTITKSNRRQCQACRLQKCLKIGMKKECIMSHNQILLKKNLMLNNKIKRNILEWKPTEYVEEKKLLVELIHGAHCQTNKMPDVKKDEIFAGEENPSSSPASSSSSGFSDLINRMTQDIVATAPGQSGASKAHMRHFSDIMEFSIKEIIKFCKKIPTFVTLSLKDQITLLKSGCTEILFIKANYTYDREQSALTCGPGKYYTRESFILGGMSEEYTDCYLKFHHDLSHMQLDDRELSCMCAATLFSSDRDELENRLAVESQQEEIVVALQAYSENTYHCRLRFPKIMAYLTRLRTLNWHISHTLKRLQRDSEARTEITPLVLEVTPST